MNGEKELFADIVRAHHERVHRLCYGFLRQQAWADEAAQDIFLKAYKALGKFKGNSQLSTWLHRLTVNHCMDLLRTRSREKTDSLEGLWAAIGDRVERLFRKVPPPEKPTIAEQADQMSELVAMLKPDYRQVIWMREVEEQSYAEIAQKLGVTIDSVKAKLKRARQELKEKWATRLKPPQRLNAGEQHEPVR